MNPLTRLSQRLRPDLVQMEELERAGNLLNMYNVLLGLLPATAVLIWLVAVTDVALIRQTWPRLLLLALITVLFSRLNFRLLLEARPGVFVSTGGSLETLIIFSALLIFGPTGLWLLVVSLLINLVYDVSRRHNLALRWASATEFVNGLLTECSGGLVAMWAYARLGGAHPYPGLEGSVLLPTVVAVILSYLVSWLVFSPLLIYISRMPELNSAQSMANGRQMILFSVVGSSLSAAAFPFAVFAADIYVNAGFGRYLFLASMALLASLLANRLSQAVQQSQQRSRELANLEALNRAIIDAPPDASTLPELLANAVPRMLGLRPICVWRAGNTNLHDYMAEFLPDLASTQAAIESDRADYELGPGIKTAQWHGHTLAVPIKADDDTVRGGICVMLPRQRTLDFLPGLQSLAAAIAAALHRAEVHQQLVANERMARELEVAGEIQATFLPDAIPAIPGWDIAATLVPARQTSGDFYDFIPLGDDRLGILVADVADKGTGAALYMALSRTLIRTYALQYPDAPELVLQTANERIRQDTESDQFVTVFYGILDTGAGTLTYANAGHNPAFLLSRAGATQSLARTGIPLGMFTGMAWKRNQVELAPGDLLLLYTDGVTEAQDLGQALFGEERLLTTGRSHQGQPAPQVQAGIVAAIQSFVGSAPQFDDITLMVLARLAPAAG